MIYMNSHADRCLNPLPWDPLGFPKHAVRWYRVAHVSRARRAHGTCTLICVGALAVYSWHVRGMSTCNRYPSEQAHVWYSDDHRESMRMSFHAKPYHTGCFTPCTGVCDVRHVLHTSMLVKS